MLQGFLTGWKNWRRFSRLPEAWRHIVFYAESGQDWHQFSGLIAELNEVHAAKVCYVTSDPDDPGLARAHEHYLALCIPPGWFLTIFFQVNRSDAFVLTMMDLDNLQLKRSLHPVHYVYLFHSMGSTHMVDNEDSFDHYDTLFCACTHQVTEIRAREALKSLPAKSLFDYGHPRLEEVMELGRSGPASGENGGGAPVVLVAPTWGDHSLFNTCGEALIEILLRSGMRVIMRPHYQSTWQIPERIDAIRSSFENHPGFSYVDRMGETGSLLDSHILITDWSAMALEYALGLEKPVLFIDLPRRVRNPNWRELGLEPVESSIRSQVGEVLPVEALEGAPAAIGRLIEDPERFRANVRRLREDMVFRLGHSVPDGAAEIVRIAARARDARSSGAGEGGEQADS